MSTRPSRTDRLAARWPAAVRRRAVAAGLAFGVVGFLVALVVAGYWALTAVSGAGMDPVDALGVGLGMPLAAGLAAVAVGAPLWWKLVETPDEPTAIRGGVVGVAVGVLAHPPTWLLFGLGWLAVDPPAAATAGTPGEVVRALLLGYVAFTVVSTFVGGLVTVPVATVTGIVLARLRERAPEAVAGRRPSRHI